MLYEWHNYRWTKGRKSIRNTHLFFVLFDRCDTMRYQSLSLNIRKWHLSIICLSYRWRKKIEGRLFLNFFRVFSSSKIVQIFSAFVRLDEYKVLINDDHDQLDFLVVIVALRRRLNGQCRRRKQSSVESSWLTDIKRSNRPRSTKGLITPFPFQIIMSIARKLSLWRSNLHNFKWIST